VGSSTGQFAQQWRVVIAYLLLAASVYVTKGYVYQPLLLAGAMFTLPLCDSKWQLPATKINGKQIFIWMMGASASLAIIITEPKLLGFFFLMLFFVALPEEWFFRSYLMVRIGNGIAANIVASICFTVVHAIGNGLVPSILIFFPSLVLGWIYQRQRNVITVAMLHALMNLIYMAYLHRYFESFYQLFTG
jgi:membrane protease YdiL (CAAX protease family)